MSIVDCFQPNGSTIPSSSGGSGMITENLSSQIDGSKQTFTTSGNYEIDSIRVYWNGIRQQIGETITQTGNNEFTTSFVAAIGDYIFVDYVADAV